MMRRPFLILAIGVIAAACGATQPLPSPPAGTVEPGDAAASPDSAARAALSDFEARLRDATAREGLLVRSLGAASSGTAADLRAATTQMRAWADGERAWLDDHPPEPCYDAAAAKLRAALDAMTSSADWFTGLADASLRPSDDVTAPSMGNEAGKELQAATQALIDAAALAKAARTSCS